MFVKNSIKNSIKVQNFLRNSAPMNKNKHFKDSRIVMSNDSS